MRFNLVQPDAALGKAHRSGSRQFWVILTLVFSQLFFAQASQAKWKDPLDTPAASTSKAHKTLLLDVVRAGQRLVAVGGHGHIIYSDDNGRSWQQASVPVSVTLTAVYFSSAKHGWAVGHDGVVLMSNDSGQSWKRQFDGYSANKAIVTAAKNKKQQSQVALDAAEASNNTVLIEEAEMALEAATYSLEDAEYDASTGSTKPFLDVWFYDARRGFAVGAYGMFFYTSDGGNTWKDVSARLPNPERFHLNSITLVGNRSLVVVGEMGMILRSDDLGETWHSIPSPYEGSLFSLINVGDQQLLFGLRGHVYSSSDAGISWTEIMTGSEQTLLSGVVGLKNAVLVGNGGSAILFDKALKKSRTLILEGRKAYAAVAEASDGSFILVGEAGIQLLSATGELIDQTVSMAAGDF
jgi:photosystem II stability/assembly factor-like uncharacterized protein